MHKDTQEALERLERALQAAEQPETVEDEDLEALLDGILFDDDEEEAEAFRNFANNYRAYNADRADLDLDRYSDEVYQEPKTGRGELLFTTVMLGLISLVMIIWAVMLL